MKTVYRFGLAMVLVGLGLLAASCGENNPPASSSQASLQDAAPPVQKRALPGNLLENNGFTNNQRDVVQTSPNIASDAVGPMGTAAGAAGGPANGAPQGAAEAVTKPPVPAAEEQIQIPVGAAWTLLCATFPGADGAARAQQVKDALVAATGLKGFYIVHETIETTMRVADNRPDAQPGQLRDDDEPVPVTNIFYGFYATIERNTPEGNKAQADRLFVAGLTDANGEHPLDACFFMPLEPPDPPAPVEWNLANKDKTKPDSDPTKAYWSLQIAAFRGTPDPKQYAPGVKPLNRKEAAVETVKAARAMGIEAYFYHGDSISSVCIGAWPRNAVKEGDTHSDEAAADPGNGMILVSNRELPAGTATHMTDRETGDQVRALVPRADVVSPSLLKAMLQYPDHAVNGDNILRVSTDPATKKQVMRPEPSFLVVIPRTQANARWGAFAGVGNSAGGHRDAGGGARSLMDQMQFPDTAQPPDSGQAPPVHRLRSVGDDH